MTSRPYWPTSCWSGRSASWQSSSSSGPRGPRFRSGAFCNWLLPSRPQLLEAHAKRSIMPAGPVQIPTPIAVTLQVIEEVRQRQVRPVATYRLQLHPGFTLHDAAALVPYLHDLGVSHVYCSPYLRAKTGTTHGYDLCDHNQINPELGGD